MRTVQDFVQDCIQRGKSLQDIKRIALCTRWAGQAREIVTDTKPPCGLCVRDDSTQNMNVN